MPGDLRQAYYLAADVRELDRIAIEEHHIPGFTLMRRAGAAAFNVLLQKWPGVKRVVCFCGNGNNGGDGYIIAALAKKQALGVSIYCLGDPARLKGDARLAFEEAGAEQVPMHPATDIDKAFPIHEAADTVIVDAMLGTGLSGDVREPYRGAIARINRSGCPVLAVDIPSGLCSDTGVIPGEAVKADMTVTFIGRKRGQVTGAGPDTCGELVFDDLGVPPGVYARVTPVTPG